MGGRSGTARGASRPVYGAASVAERAAQAGLNSTSVHNLQVLAEDGPNGATVAAALIDAFPASVDGYRLERTVGSPARYDDDNVLVSVRVNIYDKNGRRIGEMDRNFRSGPKSVAHSHFRLERGAKGKGLGYKLFKQGVDAYTKAGLKTLNVVASGGDGHNGGYTWGRFGFQFASSAVAKAVNHNFGSYLSSLGVAEGAKQRIIGKLAKSNRPGDYAKVVAVLPDGRRFHAGKEFMTNQSWGGTFDLRKGSADRRYMNDYQRTSAKIRAQLDTRTR